MVTASNSLSSRFEYYLVSYALSINVFFQTIKSGASTSKSECLTGIEKVNSTASNRNSYEKRSSAGFFQFFLKSSNGEVLGRSDNYVSITTSDRGIDVLMSIALSAIVSSP